MGFDIVYGGAIICQCYNYIFWLECGDLLDFFRGFGAGFCGVEVFYWRKEEFDNEQIIKLEFGSFSNLYAKGD